MGNGESIPKQYTIEEIFTKDITDKLITLEDYRALYFLLEYENYYSPSFFNLYFIIQYQDIRSIKKNIVDRKFNNCYKPLDKNILIQTIDKINKPLKYAIKIILFNATEEKNEKEINYFKGELKRYEKVENTIIELIKSKEYDKKLINKYYILKDENKALQTKYNALEVENTKLRERVKILDESNF
jgi:hypothetical protein